MNLNTRSAVMLGRAIIAATITTTIIIAVAVRAAACDPYVPPTPVIETWEQRWTEEATTVTCADPIGTGWVVSTRYTTWGQGMESVDGVVSEVGAPFIVTDDTAATIVDDRPDGADECAAPVEMPTPTPVVHTVTDGVTNIPAGELG